MGGGQDLYDAFTDTAAAGQGERTFLGDLRLSTRVVLFALLGLLAIVAVGAVFFYADGRLSAATDRVVAAQETAEMGGRAERLIWEIRSETEAALRRGDIQAPDGYERQMTALTELLSTLYRRPDSARAHEPITTVSEALGQHATTFRTIMETRTAIGDAGKPGLLQRMQTAGANLEEALTAGGDAALSALAARLRRLETLFAVGGSEAALASLRRLTRDAAGRIKASEALTGRLKARAADLLTVYTAEISSLAEARGRLDAAITHLEELFDYMAPSVETMTAVLQDGVAAAIKAQRQTRADLRLAVPAATVAILAVLTLMGIVLLRSVTAPVGRLAEAATLLAEGEDAVTVPALGNLDEVGDVARVLTLYRANAVEAERLRVELERLKDTVLARARAAAQPGGALVARPAPWPGAAEAAPPEGKEAEEDKGAGPPALGWSAAGRLAGPISSVSRQVARSSQHVSTAAFDAERAGALIRGLGAADEKIAEVVALLGAIAEQTDVRVAMPRLTGTAREDGGEHLVVLSSEAGAGGAAGRPGDELAQRVLRRFDEVRRTAEEARRAMAGIAETLDRVRRVAADIATSTSAEALAVTTALLEQSEYLRGMLDDLIDNIHETPHGTAAGENAGDDEEPPPAKPPRGRGGKV